MLFIQTTTQLLSYFCCCSFFSSPNLTQSRLIYSDVPLLLHSAHRSVSVAPASRQIACALPCAQLQLPGPAPVCDMHTQLYCNLINLINVRNYKIKVIAEGAAAAPRVIQIGTACLVNCLLSICLHFALLVWCNCADKHASSASSTSSASSASGRCSASSARSTSSTSCALLRITVGTACLPQAVCVLKS